MTGHATVLNLLPLSDTDEKLICSRLGVDNVTLVPGREVRERGARGGLDHLRKIHRQAGSDVFAINSLNWSRQSQRSRLYGLACLIPAKKRIVIDARGKITPLTLQGLLFRELPGSVAQKIAGARLIAKNNGLVTRNLAREYTYRIAPPGSIKNILYLRTDLWFGVKAGGSIGHVAGVINGFKNIGVDVHVLSWDRPLLISPEIGFTEIQPDTFFINERELGLLSYNGCLASGAAKSITGDPPDAVYARYALDCWAPVAIAEMFQVPLILEYNGSEVWIEKNWGAGLKYPDIAARIEDWVLKIAEVITVVSRPLKDELVGRGFDEKRILVNPNCVDPARFDPARFSTDEISKLKRDIGIPEGTVVAGFIGTFSPWHGVEVLARAIPLALKDCSSLHFLLIGSGPLFDKVKDRLRVADVLDRVTMTGLIPQDEAPNYLMCADFFLSPHVPNPDGTPFFGSPTKLFEYMALGKGIIASDLDQLGEIISNEETGLLVPPGDSKALARAIERLFDDRELSERLGRAARERAMSEYTWEAHVERILEHLYKL